MEPPDENETALPPNHPPIDPEAETALPPNHPAIDPAGGASPHGSFGASSDEAPGITWKVDPSWKSLPNPSSMRLATYGVGDAELSISRAGGDTDANIARWAGQFEGGPKPERKDSTVHGMKVAEVEIEGRFSGGMGPGSSAHDGWAMLGAIVEAPGQPYFFKLTGPQATVRGARAKFDAMIASATPGTSK
jgi:hypothetical protein